MLHLMLTIMKHGRRENTRSLQETEGREGNIINQRQRLQPILRLNHLNLIVILTLNFPHLTLVLQVMTDEGRGRDLKKKNIDVAKEEIGGVKRSERDVIKDPNIDQEGYLRV
uniref:Peptidyl-prolyl cis-trans isomerase CYP95 isoform X2 n=1 Tax=Rhizophora mucronata TaxID=61149 RepID=A0A2P2LYE3_RHIMU